MCGNSNGKSISANDSSGGESITKDIECSSSGKSCGANANSLQKMQIDECSNCQSDGSKHVVENSSTDFSQGGGTTEGPYIRLASTARQGVATGGITRIRISHKRPAQQHEIKRVPPKLPRPG